MRVLLLDRIGVVCCVKADDEVGDAVALQQALCRGQGDAQIARVQFRDAGC